MSIYNTCLDKQKKSKYYENYADSLWKYDHLISMGNSIVYYKFAREHWSSPGLEEKLRVCQLYYHLYKAYYNKEERYQNLNEAISYEDKYRSSSGICDIKIYRDKVYRINDIRGHTKYILNNNIELKNELNSIIRNINNTQLKIDAKNIVLTNKKNAITELNNLADSLNTKGNEINNETEIAITEGKTQVEQVKQNIQTKKDFIEEIEKLEKQKKEDIENMENNNRKLKQKNGQLIQMLTALESKLN